MNPCLALFTALRAAGLSADDAVLLSPKGWSGVALGCELPDPDADLQECVIRQLREWEHDEEHKDCRFLESEGEK